MKTVIPQEGFYFDEAKHYYYLDGKKLSGVTTVLGVIAKPQLIPWSAGVAVDYIDGFVKEVAVHADWDAMLNDGTWDKITKEARTAYAKKRDDAASKGTDTHALIEDLIKEAISVDGYLTVSRPPENKQIGYFIDWAVMNQVKFLCSEKKLHSRSMWLAGTADFTCEIDGKRYVGDIKTGKAIYPTYFVQTAAYRAMLEESGEESYHGSVIVNLPKDDKPMEVKYRYDYETDKAAFLGALAIYKFNNTFV